MGLFDFLLTDDHKREKVIHEIGLEAGIFERCPICKDVTEIKNKSIESESMQQALSSYLNSGNSNLNLFQHDAQVLNNEVEKVIKKMPYFCSCQDN